MQEPILLQPKLCNKCNTTKIKMDFPSKGNMCSKCVNEYARSRRIPIEKIAKHNSRFNPLKNWEI